MLVGFINQLITVYLRVSIAMGVPSQMDDLKGEYPSINGWFRNTPIFGNLHIVKWIMLYYAVLLLYWVVVLYIYSKNSVIYIYICIVNMCIIYWPHSHGNIVHTTTLLGNIGTNY